MVQFNATSLIQELEQQNVVLSDGALFKAPLKSSDTEQSDERGYFIQYYTTSTKKPYVWERYDAFHGVKSHEYPTYFQHAKDDLEKQKSTYDWQGIKLVVFAFDSLQPLNGVKVLKEYCFEVVAPKVKTYINGKKANQEFLAKKGKMFTTKASV